MNKQKKITFFTAVLMDLNIILGVGIYFIPSIIAQKVGWIGSSCWLLSGIILFPILWNIALASRLFPGDGGFYTYCKKSLGETAGFITTWSYLIGLIATGMTQAIVLKQTFLDALSINHLNYYPLVFNIFFVGIFAIINLFSISFISKTQSFATVLKLLPIIIIIIISFFVPGVEGNNSVILSEVKPLMYCLPFAIFGFWGIESCVSIGHLLEGGPSKVFGVILTAFSISVILYTVFHFSVIKIMGIEALAENGIGFLPDFIGIKSKSLIYILKSTFIWILILNYTNAIYGVFLSNIENFFSIIQEKLLPGESVLGRINKYRRPYFSVLVIYLVSTLLLTIIPKKEIMLVIANIGIIFAFTMTLLSIFIHQKNNRKSCTFVILGFISCILLAIFSWKSIDSSNFQKAMYSFPFIIWMILGYLFYKSNQKTSI